MRKIFDAAAKLHAEKHASIYNERMKTMFNTAVNQRIRLAANPFVDRFKPPSGLLLLQPAAAADPGAPDDISPITIAGCSFPADPLNNPIQPSKKLRISIIDDTDGTITRAAAPDLRVLAGSVKAANPNLTKNILSFLNPMPTITIAGVIIPTLVPANIQVPSTVEAAMARQDDIIDLIRSVIQERRPIVTSRASVDPIIALIGSVPPPFLPVLLFLSSPFYLLFHPVLILHRSLPPAGATPISTRKQNNT